MTKKEKTIAKYVALLNDLKKKCMAGEEIAVRVFCESHKAGHMSVKAAQHFGYVKKVGTRKFKWMVSGDVTPIMAKCITDWNSEYTLKSVNKGRSIGEVTDGYYDDAECSAEKLKIVGDIHIAKDDCELVKLKYQAMLDHQKIVDLETSIKNGELALTNAKMDVSNAKRMAEECESKMYSAIDKKNSEIAETERKVQYLLGKLDKSNAYNLDLLEVMNQVPTVTYYLFGIPVWKRKEKVSR